MIIIFAIFFLLKFYTKDRLVGYRLLLAVSLIICFASCSENQKKKKDEKPKKTFSLWQLPSHNDDIMNSYVILTKHGKTIVIDGGNDIEASYLYNTLKKKCHSHVTAWFISHPHRDHVGALTEILCNDRYRNLKIDNIYGSMLSARQISVNEPTALDVFLKFKNAVLNANKTIIELKLGESIVVDSLFIEILGVKNPEITANYLNNSSVVMRVYDSYKSVLFTGDLGVEAGNKILRRGNKTCLISDYVQISHHGSHGVGYEFYAAVKPIYCLWPTPRWLWDNDGPTGKDSGPYTTLIVRRWMHSLGVKKNYLMADGLCHID